MDFITSSKIGQDKTINKSTCHTAKDKNDDDWLADSIIQRDYMPPDNGHRLIETFPIDAIIERNSLATSSIVRQNTTIMKKLFARN